jgi:ADP-ribose pyrophosphatase YjhB (NUDIX family)
MGSYVSRIRSIAGSQCLFLPGVRAIILDPHNAVLLQRRTDMAYWGLPGGSVELEETVVDALKREVKEETSLEVLRAEPMALYSGPEERFRYPNGDEIQPFAVAFIIREWQGSPKADGNEGSELRFWPLDQLPQDLVSIHADTLSDYRRYTGKFLLSSGGKDINL